MNDLDQITDRASWLAWRARWRAAYAALTMLIRERRSTMRRLVADAQVHAPGTSAPGLGDLRSETSCHSADARRLMALRTKADERRRELLASLREPTAMAA